MVPHAHSKHSVVSLSLACFHFTFFNPVTIDRNKEENVYLTLIREPQITKVSRLLSRQSTYKNKVAPTRDKDMERQMQLCLEVRFLIFQIHAHLRQYTILAEKIFQFLANAISTSGFFGCS